MRRVPCTGASSAVIGSVSWLGGGALAAPSAPRARPSCQTPPTRRSGCPGCAVRLNPSALRCRRSLHSRSTTTRRSRCSRATSRSTPLPDVLTQLAEGLAGGCLRIVDPVGEEARVYLRGGQVYAVLVPGRRPQLGSRLVSSGALAPEALAEALEAQRTELQGWRLGELLVHLGYVDQAVVEAFVQEQVLAATCDLVGWTAGSWRFRPNERTREDVAPPIDVPTLLAAVAHRTASWASLVEVVVGPGAVPVLSASGGGSAEMTVGADAWSLLCKVDGVRDVAELARECGFTLYEAGQTVYELVTAGLVEVEADEPAPDVVAPSFLPSDLTSRLSAALSPEPPLDVAALITSALREPAVDPLDQVSAALSALLGPAPTGDDAFAVRPVPALQTPQEALASAARAEQVQRDLARRERDAAELATAQAELEADRLAARQEIEASLGEDHVAPVVDLDRARRDAEERAEAERVAAEADAAARAERIEAERAEAERVEAERLAAEQAAAAEEAARIEAERVAAEQAEAERLAAEQAAAVEAAGSRPSASRPSRPPPGGRPPRPSRSRPSASPPSRPCRRGGRPGRGRARRRRAGRGRAPGRRAGRRRREEAARVEAERLAAEEQARQEAERLAAAQAEAARLEAERLAAEEQARQQAERLAAEQAEAARLEAERLAAEEQARQEAERLAAAQAEAARLEAERLAAEEQARVAAEEHARQQAEAAQAEAAAAEALRVAIEQERQREAERLAAEQARAEAERAEAERTEAERIAAEQARRAEEQARAEAERAEAERVAAEQARAEAERAEAERIAAEQSAAEQARAAPRSRPVSSAPSSPPWTTPLPPPPSTPPTRPPPSPSSAPRRAPRAPPSRSPSPSRSPPPAPSPPGTTTRPRTPRRRPTPPPCCASSARWASTTTHRPRRRSARPRRHRPVRRPSLPRRRRSARACSAAAESAARCAQGGGTHLRRRLLRRAARGPSSAPTTGPSRTGQGMSDPLSSSTRVSRSATPPDTATTRSRCLLLPGSGPGLVSPTPTRRRRNASARSSSLRAQAMWTPLQTGVRRYRPSRPPAAARSRG